MKIGFVAEPYEESHASGMAYSVLETLKILVSHAKFYELVVYSSSPINKKLVPGTYRNIIIPKSFAGKFFFFLGAKEELDFLFFVVTLLPLWVPRRVKTVLICKELAHHNIKPEGFAETIKVFVRDRVLMPHCARRATKVLASSFATKLDIMRFYKIPESKIEVIFEGFQDWGKFINVAPAITEKMRPYYLFAGKVKSRKNVHGLVVAFIDFIRRTRADCNLVISGDYGGHYYKNIIKKLDESGYTSKVFFVGYVDAPMMYSLYKNAVGFVFPSFSEGFGMPLVEAMSIGVPVITSNLSAMAEVVGGAGVLVNPRETASISAAMEKVFYDEKLREGMTKKGLERANLFSWDKVAHKYSIVLEEFRRYTGAESRSPAKT